MVNVATSEPEQKRRNVLTGPNKRLRLALTLFVAKQSVQGGAPPDFDVDYHNHTMHAWRLGAHLSLCY